MGDKLNKKVALVTGALGGIGTAICKDLVDNDYHVIATMSRPDPERCENWCTEHQLDKENFDFVAVDVNDHQTASKILEEALQKYETIDALVNAAGITRDSTFKKMSFEKWQEVITTNLTSLYTVVHPVFLRMLEQKHGRIINISSINGLRGQYGQTNYSATKAGIIGFTKALAYEGAQASVTANVVAPGYTMTPMVAAVPEKVLDKIKTSIPMNRLAEATDISAAVMYLLSDSASYVTGETISVNGGQYMN